MNDNETKLIQALETLLLEINYHNADYHHYTKPEVIEPIVKLIDDCKTLN